MQVFATKLNLARSTLAHAGSSDDEETIEVDDEKKQAGGPKRFDLRQEFPFDSTVKRMSTLYFDNERPDEPVAYLKGAVGSTSYHIVDLIC